MVASSSSVNMNKSKDENDEVCKLFVVINKSAK